MKTIEQYNFYYSNLHVSLSYIMISLFIEQINSLDYVCVKFKHF